MPNLGRFLTAALFITHLLAGCCAHHAHACEDPVSSATCARSDSSGGQADHIHHGTHNCRVGNCFFVLPARLPDNSARQPVQAFSSASHDEFCSSSSLSSDRRFLPTGRLSLPVRLHLVNQVLLI